MPPKGRIKNANQHDKRHDAGLAAPAKRISKDKVTPAISTVNGHANGKSAHSPTASQYPSTSLGQQQTTSNPSRPDYPPGEQEGSEGAADSGANSISEVKEQAAIPEDRTAVVEDEEIKEMNPRVNTFPATRDRSTSETICTTKDAQSLRAIASQASSTLALAATILSACPLRDAIAILILLLSLPPTLIIVIHSLFASLTFVPPTAGFSWSSWTTFPSIGDWFHATPGGGPSPFTILFSDIVMTLIYLACPLHLQNIFMDLGQAVIAISLSGAAAGSGSSTRSVAFCSGLILCSHLFRFKALHFSALQYLVTGLRNAGLEFYDRSFVPAEAVPSSPLSHGWFRLLLGCHVLAQGLLTLLRRWFAGANQQRQISKLDAEQAALFDSGKLAMLNLDGDYSIAGTSSDGRPPGPSPAVRDSKEKVSNTRRKRKQATQVRSQQPLWAAIASTKVTFLKEMEHKHLSDDKKEVATGGMLESGLPLAQPTNDRIWILDISPTRIRFKVELHATAMFGLDQGDDTVPPSPGIDKQKPFYVRLNKADWGSTRIFGAEGDSNGGRDGSADGNKVNWSGEVYGLSPLTKYACEFVRMRDQHVICSTNLITLPAPNTEQTVTLPAPSQHQSLRPMSPTSTLKQSIQAVESKRDELRNKLKRSRKDHKTATSAIRREIDQLQSKVASSGGQDERSRQRVLQLKQHVKQADDALEVLKEEIENIGEIPKEELDFAASRRKSYDGALEAKNAAKAELDTAKAEANKGLTALQAEISTTSQKRDRLNTRRSKLSEQYERLVSEQHADMSARQRHELERASMREERNRFEEQLAYWTNASKHHAEEINIRANEFFQQLQHAEEAAQAHLNIPPGTPEGNLPGTSGPRGPSMQAFDFSSFNTMGGHGLPSSGLHGHKWGANAGNGSGGSGGRQRSSSMLSGYSGFTDDIDVPQQQQQQYHNGYGQGRKDSDGSGESSGRSYSEGPTRNTSHWDQHQHTGSPGPVPLRTLSGEY